MIALKFNKGMQQMNRLLSNASDVTPSTFSPSLHRYMTIKEQNPKSLVMVEVGDFFEAFLDDAKTLSNKLDLILISKRSGDDRIAMAGVPAHAIGRYVRTLHTQGAIAYIGLKVIFNEASQSEYERLTYSFLLDGLYFPDAKAKAFASVVG
jgi:MutS domain I